MGGPYDLVGSSIVDQMMPAVPGDIGAVSGNIGSPPFTGGNPFLRASKRLSGMGASLTGHHVMTGKRGRRSSSRRVKRGSKKGRRSKGRRTKGRRPKVRKSKRRR